MVALDHFDWVAPHYERVFGVRHLDRLFAHLAPGAGHWLLDVGGGTGQIAQQFAGQVRLACVLEPSSGMLAQGRSKGICQVQGVAEDMPFPSGSLDRVCMVDTFHHLLDHGQAARELVRVLAPGGRLVIQEPDIQHWSVKWVALAEKALCMRSRFFTPQAIQAMFERLRGVENRFVTRVERQEHTAWIIVDRL
jgi:demethylmenaquinone methyltransferase/2-methoxy-6-polyprenyl-1,4-benzoquinol methylase